MRWIPLIILAYVVVVVQTTLGRVLSVNLSVGTVSPDLLAVVALFVALHVREGVDVMLACWLLGLTVDLTAGGALAVTAIGPMAISYTLAGGAMFAIREAFFHDRLLTRAVLTFVFCLLAHGLWVTIQSLLAISTASWRMYATMLLQAALLAIYSALVSPLVLITLMKLRRWLIPPATDR